MSEVDGSEQSAAQADSREGCSRRIGHCVREFSGCEDEPVAEIVPNTQPIAPRHSKSLRQRELSVRFRFVRCDATESDR